MATEVVETIGSGGDFADISSWVAALPADLVAADEVRVGRLIDAADYGEASTIDISGITTDATRYVQLEAASGVRHNGTGDASGARYVYTGGGHAFTVGIDHFRVRWIDFSYPSGGGTSDEIFRWSGVGEFRAEFCLGHDIDGASQQDFLYPSAGSGTREIRVSNCLFWSIARAALHNQGQQDITWYVYNCAAWDTANDGFGYGGFGFDGSPNTGSVMVCKNVYSHHSEIATAFFDKDGNGDFTGSTNNASNDSSAPGTNPLTGQDPSTDVQFVGLSGTIDLHISSGSTLEDAGVDLSGDADYPISTDIDGETRSGTWDIGADELDTAAPTLTSATASDTGRATADGSVDTDTGEGTLYWVVTQSATKPTVGQIQAGENHIGQPADDSGNQAVSATGTQNVSSDGLTEATRYWFHYQQEDAVGNDSAVVSASFTTHVALGLSTFVLSPGVVTVDTGSLEVRVAFPAADLPGGELPITGLEYAVWPQASANTAELPSAWGAPSLQGSDGEIDNNRDFALEVTGTFNEGDVVYLYLSDSDGTVAEFNHCGGPVTTTPA